MTHLVHFFGPLKLVIDLDALRIVAIESIIAGVPPSAFSGPYLQRAEADALAHAAALGY